MRTEFQGAFRARVIRLIEIALGVGLSVALPAFGQTDNTPPRPPVPALVGIDNSSTPPESGATPEVDNDRMMVPPPVSGQTYPIVLGSQEKSNYLSGGLSFTTA